MIDFIRILDLRHPCHRNYDRRDSGFLGLAFWLNRREREELTKQVFYQLAGRISMEKPLSPSAQKVQDALIALGYSFKVIESELHTRTAQQAADTVGCTLGQITKSLIFKGQVTGKPILVLTSGANRVDESLISTYAKEPIDRANPDFVRTVTGFAIGGVPPMAHILQMEAYLDEDLMQYKSIWAAAGTPNSIFELTPEALKVMTGGYVVRVK